MDPECFLDIELDNKENKENLNISDVVNYAPDGSWIIHPEVYKIIYKNKKYTEIQFNSTTKNISFYDNTKLMLNIKWYYKKLNYDCKYLLYNSNDIIHLKN